MGDIGAQHTSPAARGRLLLREARELLVELGSMKKAASALVGRHPDVPSLVAYRYVAGLSQEGAAKRYNEETGHGNVDRGNDDQRMGDLGSWATPRKRRVATLICNAGSIGACLQSPPARRRERNVVRCRPDRRSL